MSDRSQRWADIGRFHEDCIVWELAAEAELVQLWEAVPDVSQLMLVKGCI